MPEFSASYHGITRNLHELTRNLGEVTWDLVRITGNLPEITWDVSAETGNQLRIADDLPEVPEIYQMLPKFTESYRGFLPDFYRKLSEMCEDLARINWKLPGIDRECSGSYWKLPEICQDLQKIYRNSAQVTGNVRGLSKD